ncbi:MAG: rhomboid family intramembrane serine protease [Spirochaetia bacterium]
MKIRYNAPVTLTFALAAAVILLIDQAAESFIISTFAVPGKSGFEFSNFSDYLRILLHPLGHADWTHLLSNFAFILLLGPILEEKYGSLRVLVMMIITAFVTGILNALFFPHGLMGASGIVFMMILLISFTNIRQGEIPITFILIVLIYLAREIINSVQENTISEFAHIMGGICGSLFGFTAPRTPPQTPQVKDSADS